MNLIQACVVTCGLLALGAAPPARKDAPEFWAHSACGDAIHLADSTPSGKWVLVKFWSSGERRARDQVVMAQLREKGLEDCTGVKAAYMEADGKISIIRQNDR